MSTKEHRKKVREEILSCMDDNGLIYGEALIEKGEDPNSALNKEFEWDNKKAGHQYRLNQARKLIVSVTMLEPKSKKSYKVFISLKSDRNKPGGGYRETVTVLSDKELREILLQQAWDEFEYWREQYGHLKELGTIFAAADKVKKKKSKAVVKKKTTKKTTRRKRPTKGSSKS